MIYLIYFTAPVVRGEAFRFEIIDVIVHGVAGQHLIIHQLPKLFLARYGEIPQIIFVRDCYGKLYSIVSDLMSEGLMNYGVTLFTGVPGIGKSLFLVYWIYRFLQDNRFPDKRFALEFESGTYCYFQPTAEATLFSCTQKYGNYLESNDFLLLCDITKPMEPFSRAKWTLIFSSPSPLRYKEILKNSPHFKYIMPTWSEQELMFVNIKIDVWYEDFVLFGGVPRYVFQSAPGISARKLLDRALADKDESIVTEFFKFSFATIDSLQGYMLVHINPSISDDGEYDYTDTVYSFASDFIFQNLMEKHNVAMLAGAVGMFNCGAASETNAAVSAGNLFEKICLWLKPLNGQRIVATSLSGVGDFDFMVPVERLLLPHNWKTTADLPVNKLNLPRISNLESGDAFCVVGESANSFSLVVFQVTVGNSHPVKVKGLCDIWNAFPSNVKENIKRKVLVFVIPLHGSLDQLQRLITKKGEVANVVPHVARDFEQYVYRYQI